jgi:hypothetical protein
MKRQAVVSRSICQAIGRLMIIVGMMLTINTLWLPRAQAQDGDARKILKSMSDFMAGQKASSLTFDSDIEVITTDLQKIQFTSSGQLQMVRPDKLHARRTGGYKDIEIVFDGKTLTINNKDGNSFAQVDANGSIDQLVDLLREKYGVVAPGADLLFSDVFKIMIEDVIDAKHIGRGVIDGVECEHLAFRTPQTDWQIWVEVGARPIPRKYVITSKTVAGAPQYTLRIKEWRTDVPADAFVFKPPQGAKKMAIESLHDIDEVPPGIVAVGGKK